jgi:hypothetical protein
MKIARLALPSATLVFAALAAGSPQEAGSRLRERIVRPAALAIPRGVSSTGELALLRNPFRFAIEEEAGLTYEELLERRDAEAASSVPPLDSLPAAPPPAGRSVLAARIESCRIAATLIAGDGGAALVDGEIVRVGETLFEGRAKLVAVGRDAVEFEVDGVGVGAGEIVRVLLAATAGPPNLAHSPDSPGSPGSIDSPDSPALPVTPSAPNDQEDS